MIEIVREKIKTYLICNHTVSLKQAMKPIDTASYMAYPIGKSRKEKGTKDRAPHLCTHSPFNFFFSYLVINTKKALATASTFLYDKVLLMVFNGNEKHNIIIVK